MKKIILSILALFVLWSVMDFIIHGVILASTYEATAQLWRPMEEMKMILMHFVTLVYAVTFVWIYAKFFAKKNLSTAIQFGLLAGLGSGISMGYGSYSVMPIPYMMALVWFLGTLVEGLCGGVILGLIIKD